MTRVVVGVIRGGPSSEYDVSLKTGGAVLKNIPEDKYAPLDIFLDKNGGWHVGGIPMDPREAISRTDVLFNALHGEYGEDGGIQELLESHGKPYTGSGVFASRLAMNKALAKRFLQKVGVKTPLYEVVSRESANEEEYMRIFRTIPIPVIVKPLDLGSSVGITIAKSFFEFVDALNSILSNSEYALVEEFINGREATVGVINHFRGEETYVLPPIEIIPPSDSPFFDYDAKYGGRSQEICPGNFSREHKDELLELARTVHKELGLRHYSRSDFMISPRRGIYFLEANTLPGLTTESLLPKSFHAVGCSFPQFLDHVITLALESK